MFPFTNLQFLSASFEIITMLIGAFLLGVLFARSSVSSQENLAESPSPEKTQAPVNKKSNLQKDDLQLIEGIGPALEKVLQKNGVSSYADIMSLDIKGLEELLISLGGRYAKYNPTTWPDQADLAHRKKWSELEEYQDIMKKSKKQSS